MQSMIRVTTLPGLPALLQRLQQGSSVLGRGVPINPPQQQGRGGVKGRPDAEDDVSLLPFFLLTQNEGRGGGGGSSKNARGNWEPGETKTMTDSIGLRESFATHRVEGKRRVFLDGDDVIEDGDDRGACARARAPRTFSGVCAADAAQALSKPRASPSKPRASPAVSSGRADFASSCKSGLSRSHGRAGRGWRGGRQGSPWQAGVFNLALASPLSP